MKNILFAFAFLCLNAQAQTFLIGLKGESNWVSRANPDSRFEVAATPNAFWYKQSTNSLEPLIDAIGEDVSAGVRSAAPAMAQRLKQLYPGCRIIFVPSAVGGSRIVSWSKGTLFYNRALSMWNACLAYCTSNSIAIDHKLIAWEQGGNDVTHLETDGYYYYLNNLVNDFVSDFGAEQVFGIRIGYDPNFAPAAEVEKIMKGTKLVGFNNPHFTIVSNTAATFNQANEKMQGDGVHWSLKGQNEEGTMTAEGIAYYLQTSQKITVAEPVASLQNVTTGYINLNPNWAFEFDYNVSDSNQNATGRYVDRNAAFANYTDGGSLAAMGAGWVETSRPFLQSEFTITMRFRCTGQGTQTLFCSGEGSANKVALEISGANSYVTVNIGGAGFYTFTNDIDWTQYHIVKLQQTAGLATLFVDGVQKIQQPSPNALTMNYIGGGSTYNTDLTGAIDYFRTGSGNTSLPIGIYTPMQTRRVAVKKLIYPNPATSYVIVPEESKIYNVLGQLVKTGNGRISVRSLPAGTYIVWSGNGVQKLIIAK